MPCLVRTSRSWQNLLSPNETQIKGYRYAEIKTSAHASHKTHACISLKQRSYSRNYGLACNLGKQMAVSTDLVDQASGFANGRRLDSISFINEIAHVTIH